MRVIKLIGEPGTTILPARGTKGWLTLQAQRRALLGDIIKHTKDSPSEEKNPPSVKNEVPARKEIITARQAESEYSTQYKPLIRKLSERYSITFEMGETPNRPLFSRKHNWNGTPGQYMGKLELFISTIGDKHHCRWTGNSGNEMQIKTANILPTLESILKMEPKARVPASETYAPQPVQREAIVQETAAPLLLDNEKIDDKELAQNYLNKCKNALSELGMNEPILVIVESANGECVWKSNKMKENIMHDGKKKKERYTGRISVSFLYNMISIITCKAEDKTPAIIYSIDKLDDAISVLKKRLTGKSARTEEEEMARNDYQNAQ